MPREERVAEVSVGLVVSTVTVAAVELEVGPKLPDADEVTEFASNVSITVPCEQLVSEIR